MINIKKYSVFVFILLLFTAINFTIAQNNPADEMDDNDAQIEAQLDSEIQSGLQSLTKGIGLMVRGKAMIEAAGTTSYTELKDARIVVGENMMAEGDMAVKNGLDQVMRGQAKLMEKYNVGTSTEEMMN